MAIEIVGKGPAKKYEITCTVCGRNLNSFDTHIECMSRVPIVNHREARKRRHTELLKLLGEATS